MQTQFQLGSYIHECTNETHFSSKSTRLNPYFGRHNYRKHKLATKVVINLVDLLKMCFICAGMDLLTQLVLCLHEQTQIAANAACRVGSQQFLS